MRAKEVLLTVGTLYGLYELSKFGFSRRVKQEAWENAGRHCERCGVYIPAPEGIHHCVPANALKRRGVKGRDNLANARVLCNEQQNDCHELADQMAIRKQMFWNGSDFVPLSQVNTEAYTQFYPRPRKKHRRR